MRAPAAIITVSSLLALAACGGNLTGSVTPPSEEVPQEETPPSQEEVMDGDYVNIPGFSVPGRYLESFGEKVMTFQYPTVDDANVDAAKVSPDGHFIDGVEVPWDGPVHFFQRDDFIAVYVGENGDVLDALSRGGEQPQFAGD